MIYVFLGSSLGKVKLAKFHHCRICVTDFRDGGIPPPPTLSSVSSPEKAHPE